MTALCAVGVAAVWLGGLSALCLWWRRFVRRHEWPGKDAWHGDVCTMIGDWRERGRR